MTLGPGDKRALSELRFQKAVEFLEDPRANLDGGRLKTAVHRSYFAALSAVRALLILEGANPESRAGAITTLSLRFVKPDLLPIEVTKSLKLLPSRRTDVDYGDFESVDAAEANDSLRRARYVLDQVEALREKLISELPG